jgi:hypothetical protein
MTEIVYFPLRWVGSNFSEDRVGAAGAGETQRALEPEHPLLVQTLHERQAPPKAPAVGEADYRVEKPANLEKSGVAERSFLKAPSRTVRDGEACITSDYTGTAEAAILSLPGIRLMRAGKHYRSFRCCGPDETGRLVKNWNVVEEAVGVNTRGDLLWKLIHRFVSDLTDPASRLKEIDAQLRVLDVPQHAAGALTVIPLFRRKV